MTVLLVGNHPHISRIGQATVTVMIRAHNAMGEVNIVPNNQIGEIAFTLGTRVLLTCDVTGLSEDNKVLKYKWYHKCTFHSCEIRDEDPYYRVVADTLLVEAMENSGLSAQMGMERQLYKEMCKWRLPTPQLVKQPP